MIFILIVAFSALFVAGCAAFFSIKGLIVLFSGSALAIGIMASSLEIGKLVAASFLHAHWKRINFLLKSYLCLAVFVLMTITSLGIFGYLTGAYQVHSAKVGTFETQIASLSNEKTTTDQTISEFAERIKTLTEVRAAQEQRIQAAGNFKAPREQAYKAIAEANEEIQKKETDIDAQRNKSIAIDKELAELRIKMNTTTDIGSFKFIASALNSTVDEAVRYFIFLLMFVFDPLAVTLVLAWNNLLDLRKKTKEDAHRDYEQSLHTIASVPVVPTYETAPKPAAIEEQPAEKSQETEPELESLVAPVVQNLPVEPVVLATVSESNIHIEEQPSAHPTPSEDIPDVAAQIEAAENANRIIAARAQAEAEAARRRMLAGNNNSVMTI